MEEAYVKEFDIWNEYIKNLDTKEFQGFFREREIWWCALGVNVGSEQDGKNEDFERPVLVVRGIRRDLLLVAPITSRISDHEYRITADIAGQESQILLSQVRVISSKRLLRKIGWLKANTFKTVLIDLMRMILEAEESETPPEMAGNLGARRQR